MSPSDELAPALPGCLSILLVEDSRLIAERIGELITAIPDMRLVTTVDSEREALALLSSQAIDVVVLDLHLREGTGFGVLRGLAARDAPRAVAIVLTNYDLAEYRRTATTLGAREFLDKARDFDRLSALLQEISAERLAS
jgi:two-component system, OmpR family, response regulator